MWSKLNPTKSGKTSSTDFKGIDAAIVAALTLVLIVAAITIAIACNATPEPQSPLL